MAHAHDRTLLASLSFGDPDKKDPLHDLGCQYISQPSVCNAMNIALQEGGKLEFDESRCPVLEAPITKGEGKYKTMIGFIDVTLPFKNQNGHVDVFAEVKIKPVELGEILRQISLYREFKDGPWILVADFDMTASLEEGLKAHGIMPIRLGEGFKSYVEQQRFIQRPGTATVI